MQTWKLTLHGPAGILSESHSQETQFVLGTEPASDVWTVAGEGVAPRHARVWIAAGGIQVEDLAGGTVVNGHPIDGRVEAEYPASVQVGSVTLVVEVKASVAAGSAAEITISQRTPTWGGTTAHGRPAPLGAPNKAPVVSEYTLVREIARGGMGQIYFGEDPQLERQVAVKVSSISEGGEDPRFSKEAKVLAQLAHPNIVPIHAIGLDSQGRPFYSMKLVKGRTLQALLNAVREGDAAAVKEYPRATLLTVFRKVCDAMAFAHAKGVLHRDLKPENIMVGEYGEVLVMDWGLAKVLGGEDVTGGTGAPANDSGDYGMTLEGEVMGTPQYMSPEQAEGMVGELDARSDIYSLGGILYAILTLRPPVDGNTLNEVLTKVKKGEISSMATKRDGKGDVTAGTHAVMGNEVPEALQAVTLKAMATDRAQRYPSVEAFAADIDAYQNGFATSAEHAGFARQILLLLRRNKAVSGLCAVLLVSAMVFSLRLIASERKAVQEKTAAQISSAKAQIALAQSEDQAQNPQAMRRILDAVPREYRDQHWSYLDAKLAPPSLMFDIPGASVEAAFPTNKAPGCFLTVHSNGDVRYLDPATGFGDPLFRVPSPVKDLAFTFFEDPERAWLAVVVNRSTRLGDKNYPASLEVLEVPAGKSVYKVGLDRPCVDVDFSPKGNLMRLESLPPINFTIQIRNAYSGEMVWEGGPEERVSCKFSPDEKRLVCVIENKGFQDLDPWTGAPLGSVKNGSGSHGVWSVWSPQADRLYAFWNQSFRTYMRGFNSRDDSTTFEYTVTQGSAPRLCCGRRSLFLTTTRSSEGRMVEILDPFLGVSTHKMYLLGDYGIYFMHSDENHFLCVGSKKAAFLRWNFAETIVADLPRIDGPFCFMEGSLKLAVCAVKDRNAFFKILDLSKPKGEAGPAFSVRVRGEIFANKAGSLFSYKEDSPTGESVIARADLQGIRQVSRWKSASIPQLGPSGEWAWTREGLYETASGQMLQKYDRKGLGRTQASGWLDEKHVLEIAWIKRKDESDAGEFNETVYVLWEADTGRALLRMSEPRARTFGVSPDGLWIAEGGEDGWLRIRSAKTLEIQKEYKVHDAAVSRAEWHPTKPVIVTCSPDYWVKVWDARNGSMVQSFRCRNHPFNIAINEREDLIGVGNLLSGQIFSMDLSRLRD